MVQRRLLLAVLPGCLALMPLRADAADGSEAANAPREVNITSGSTPGWIPSEELEKDARLAWERYFGLLESAEYQAAYDMMTEGLKALLPFAQFRKEKEQFLAEAGKLRERRLIKLTWTKDAPDLPNRGIYAAIYASAQFDRVDRECGYLILYQPPGGGSFKVMRVESVHMSNATAKAIERSKSSLDVDLTWHNLSRNCPNYPAVPLTEAADATVGYPTVAAALKDLRSRSGVVFTTVNGWTIATDGAAYTIWSFAPEDYPAYPAVVKRWVTSLPVGLQVHMNTLCEASKKACDELFLTFAKMNGFLPAQ